MFYRKIIFFLPILRTVRYKVTREMSNYKLTIQRKKSEPQDVNSEIWKTNSEYYSF